jgi:hypothetical protein
MSLPSYDDYEEVLSLQLMDFPEYFLANGVMSYNCINSRWMKPFELYVSSRLLIFVSGIMHLTTPPPYQSVVDQHIILIWMKKC